VVIAWKATNPALYASHGFEECFLENGEVVGAIALSKSTGMWSASKTVARTFDTREAAMADVEVNAKARIWFLER